MIKLMMLLKEIEAEQSIIAKLSPKDKEDYYKALAILQDETLDEGLKDSLKKLGLSAAVILALAATPLKGTAQKAAVNDLKAQTTAMTAKSDTSTGTELDGKNGYWTSQFKFPTAFLRNLNTGKVSALGLKGNWALQEINKSGLTVKQMAEWNNFVAWMESKGYSKNRKMDNAEFRDKVLKEYKQIEPSFFVKGKKEVMQVQACIKGYRTYTIGIWELGIDQARKKGFTPEDITMRPEDETLTKTMDPTKPEDVKTVNDRYMIWAK